MENHVGLIIKKIETLERKVDKRNDETLEAIKSVHRKQDLTNGRIGRLEIWKGYLAGATAVIMFLLVSIIIPVLLKKL